MPTKILAALFLFLTTATLTRPRPASLAVCNKPFFQTDGAPVISHAHGAPYEDVGTWGKYNIPDILAVIPHFAFSRRASARRPRHVRTA